jgi:hypothetical protein
MTGFTLWTYRRRFSIDGVRYVVSIATGWTHLQTVVRQGDTVLGEDLTEGFDSAADARVHEVCFELPDGRAVRVIAGPVGEWSIGIAVDLNGKRIHESHPGRVIAWPDWMGKLFDLAGSGADPESRARVEHENRLQAARQAGFGPAVRTDLLTALVLLASAWMADAQTAALAGGAMLLLAALWPGSTRMRRFDGLAVPLAATVAASAAFDWAVVDPGLARLHDTALALLVCTLLLADALLADGRCLGVRFHRYVFVQTHAGHLAFGLGSAALIMAVLAWLAARAAPDVLWVIYSSYVDVAVGIALGAVAVHFARVPLPDNSSTE